MSRWTVLLAVLGAPMLLLALAGYAVLRLIRQCGAALIPRPVESEWDAAPPLVFRAGGSSRGAQSAHRMGSIPVAADARSSPWTLN
jgi:hypothetical protein